MSASQVRLGSVAKQVRGVSYDKSEVRSEPSAGYIPVLRANNITEHGLTFTDLVYVPERRVSPQQVLQPGDIVVAASSGSLEVVGKAAPFLAGPRCAFGAFCKVVRPAANVDSAFIAHYFKTSKYRRKISSLAAGANINNLRNEHLDDLAIPAFPLDEQRRIAAILDKAEELRAKRRAVIALLDQLPQSIFLEMFGDPDPSWSCGTVTHALDAAKGSIRTGPFGSQLLHSEFVDSGVAVLGIDNAVSNEFRWSQRRYISPRKYEQLKRYTVRPGDVLITIMGTCGRCAIVPADIPLAINTKHLCCLTLDLDKCVPEYLHAYFLYHPDSLSYLHQTTKGAIMGGLNMEIIKNLPLCFPPVELQRQFAGRAKAIHRAKADQQSALIKLDALFAALQRSSFQGALG